MWEKKIWIILYLTIGCKNMYIVHQFMFLRSDCNFHICIGIKILSSIHWKTYFNLQLGLFGLFSFAFLTAGSSKLFIARNMTPAHQNQGSVFASLVFVSTWVLWSSSFLFLWPLYIHLHTYSLAHITTLAIELVSPARLFFLTCPGPCL